MSLRITGTSEQVCLSVTRIPSYCNHSFLRVSLSFLVLVLSVIAGVINFSISTASASMPPAKPALTPTATPTIQCGSSGFLPPVNYPVGPNPFAIVAADFNSDGHLDLATVNNSSASVSVLLSRGDGTFQPSVNYSVGSYPQSIAAGDLNRDGTPDLVTANNGAGDISVLLGNSNGTFRQAVSYPVAQYANFVIIVDLSGDSYPDVAVTDLQLGGSVSVLPGNGDGTLGTPTHYHTASNPLSVTAGDANNDSRIDLIVANHDSYSYSVLLGNGNGTFQPAVNYSLGSSASPSYITNADLNNDGYLDLAIANSSFAGSVSVLLGNGNGTFQPEIQYPLGQYTQWVSTGDFSGDGIVDMVAANASSSGQVAVSLGNGDGTFRPAVNYPAGAGPDAIAPGDFNGDGKLDIGASNFGSSNVSILFNACALAGGTLTPTSTGTLPTRTNTPTFTATYTRTPTASATATNSPSLTPTEVCGPMWRAYPNPDLGVYEARLYTLSAVSPNDIWAVGEQHSGASYLGLVEHWNGTQWSVVPAPNPGSSQELNGVAAISANNVWVAGEYRDPSNTTRTLLEHWNGTQFSLVSTPNSQGNANYLDDIDARSASDIWAVGYWSTDNTSAKRTLILHYNGQSWQVVQSPNVGAGNNRLRAVSAIASNDVWAVGYYDTNGANTQQNTLMMHWNGSVWSVVSSPNPPGGFYNVLNGVGAASGTDIWAVGNTYDLNTELTTTLIEHWNGTDWQIVQSPNMQVDANYLNDISVRTATDIWAVGYWSQSGTEQSLTLHWDGTQWSIVRTPYNRYDEGMGGVVALSPTDVWAVGYFEYFTGSDYQDKPLSSIITTLVEA